MNQEEYLKLYEKYIAGLCSPEEEERLYAYMDDFKMLDAYPTADEVSELQRKDQLFQQIKQTIQQVEKPFRIHLNWVKYAAAFLFILAAGMLFMDNKKPLPADLNVQEQTARTKLSITPGRNTATLTLSNGAVVDLENVENGTIASTQDAQVQKSEEGAIIYLATGKDTKAESFNTINVPAGGQYKVVLPDGTAVWLNALSMLTYPTTFSGKTREVKLEGEAYFEVAKNAAKPFIARVNGMRVTVLGTQFNINAYDKQRYKTTLVEGSVQLSQSAKQALLKPGQQGVVDSEKESIKIASVNINKIVAWKNGYFMFQDDSIKDIMAQISRWYDVEVAFEGTMPSKTFGGIYSRNKDINELLKGLELTGLVRFKIEGRRIIVMA
jgi:mannose-6-phosphate isomerase class I